MLDEGWRRFQRGTDVVIGFVETHRRPFTTQQIRDLPTVPRKQVEYRNSTWEEMDLDAVLARSPTLVLIDELAHTNVPGSGRHEKRWEDVLEILDAGIAVITTVNIQHIESLADAVERITGVGVRERVPDWVVRRADQIELIDSSADQLRRRMLHGNIYPEAKVPAALSGFFRPENLVALRELSLRFVADEAEEELLEYLRSKGTNGELWETTERIMVAVTGAPGNASVVRRAARIAARVKGGLIAVHVVSDDAAARRSDTGEARGVGHCGRRPVADAPRRRRGQDDLCGRGRPADHPTRDRDVTAQPLAVVDPGVGRPDAPASGLGQRHRPACHRPARRDHRPAGRGRRRLVSRRPRGPGVPGRRPPVPPPACSG